MLRAVSPTSEADTVSPGEGEPAEPLVEEQGNVESEIPEIPDGIEAAEPPAPPKPPQTPRPRPHKRITVDEHASAENKDILVSKAQMPVPLTDVKVPSPAEVARHNLTHLPYKRWCKFCVAARCPNVPHVRLPPFSRKHPLLVLDYSVVRKS